MLEITSLLKQLKTENLMVLYFRNKKKDSRGNPFLNMVGRERFERSTSGLKVQYTAHIKNH